MLFLLKEDFAKTFAKSIIMSNFNVEKVTSDIVNWIRDFFEKSGKGCNAIVGISGGKDSSVTAALCVKALGKDRLQTEVRIRIAKRLGLAIACGVVSGLRASDVLVRSAYGCGRGASLRRSDTAQHAEGQNACHACTNGDTLYGRLHANPPKTTRTTCPYYHCGKL